MQRFWRQLVQADRVFEQFRSRFIGKVSPVHFFWGAMDLAVTRFSGRLAPRHPGGAPNVGDWVMVEAYSHQLSSAGFWPGGGDEGAFCAYAYPIPDGFSDQPVRPGQAFFHDELGESCCPMKRSAPPRTRMRRCSSSCRRPTRRPPSSESGTGARSKTTQRVARGRANPAPLRSSLSLLASPDSHLHVHEAHPPRAPVGQLDGRDRAGTAPMSARPIGEAAEITSGPID